MLILESTFINLRYMSMLSLNRKTPFAFNTPSMPSASLGKGSLCSPCFGSGSADLSVTRTRPCVLIASISAGTISCKLSVLRFKMVSN